MTPALNVRHPLALPVAAAAVAMTCLTCGATAASADPSADPSATAGSAATLRLSVAVGAGSLRPGASTPVTVRVLAGSGTLEGVTLSLRATRPAVLSSGCSGCALGTVGTGGKAVGGVVSVPASVTKATTIAFSASASAANAPGQTRGVVISVRPKAVLRPKPSPKKTRKPGKPKPTPSAPAPAPTGGTGGTGGGGASPGGGPSPVGLPGPGTPSVPRLPGPQGSLQPIPPGREPVVLPQVDIPAPTLAPEPLADTTRVALRNGVSPEPARPYLVGLHAAWLVVLLLSVVLLYARLNARPARPRHRRYRPPAGRAS